MAEEVDFTAKFDDSQVTAALERVAAGVDSLQGELDIMSESGEKAFKEVGKAASDSEKAIGKAAKAQVDNAEATKKSEEATRRLKEAMKQTVRETNILGVNIGTAIDLLKGFQGVLKDSISAIRGVVGALRVFKVALVSTGIGAVVLIVGALIAALTKLQPVMDKVRVITAQIGTAFGVLIDKFATIGGLIIDVVTGQKSLTQAWGEGKDAVSGLGQEMAKAASFAKQYEEAQISLERQTSLLTARIALQRGEIRRLNQEADDRGNTFGKRIAAATEAARLEGELLKDQEKLAKEKIAAELGAFGLNEKNNKLIQEQIRLVQEGEASFESLRKTLTEATPTIANDEDVNNFLTLVTELGEVQSESLDKQTELQNKIQAIEQERLQALRARLKAIQELTDTVAAANAELAGPAEVAKREYDLALRKVGELRKEAQALKLDLDFSALEGRIKAQFERALDAIQGEVEQLPGTLEQSLSEAGGAITEFLSPLQGRRDFRAEGLEVGKEISAAIARGIEDGVDDRTLGEIVLEKLDRAFNLSPAQYEFILGSVQAVFQSIVSGIDAATQAAIARQDMVIDAVSRRVDETEQALAKEEELQRQGFANNVDALKKKLKEEQAVQEEAENKRLALEKKAAQQRLLLDSLEQASSFALAIAKLTAREAFKGLPGIITAAAGIAIILGIIAKARAIKNQFEPPRLREGTPYLEGPSHERGGIHIEAEGGERIISRKLNEKIGRRVDNEQMVSLYLLGKKLQEGMANKSALPGLVEQAKAGQQRKEKLSVDIPYHLMAKAYQEAAQAQAQEMIAYWKTRPVEWIEADGTRVMERQAGGRVERKKVKNTR